MASSDSDINGGDLEDNISSDDSNFSSEHKKKATGDSKKGKSQQETSDVESDGKTESERSKSFTSDANHKKDEEFNLNVSFTGGYVPNTDLTRVDKGQGNPQFARLEIKD